MRKLLEFIPVIHYLVAASPAFLSVMEDWLPGMMQTSLFVIVSFHVLLAATVVFAGFLLCLHGLQLYYLV